MSKKNAPGHVPQALLDTVLHPMPSQHRLAENGLLQAHVTSEFHEYRPKSGRYHEGVDFNYNGGQTGINLQHPTFYSPVKGRVINDPTKHSQHGIQIQDEQGDIHILMHASKMHVKYNQMIEIGQPLGQMGDFNRKNPNGLQHIHYEIKDRKGHPIDPADYWNKNLSKLDRKYIQAQAIDEILKDQRHSIQAQIAAETKTQTQNQTQNQNQGQPKSGIIYNTLDHEIYQQKVWDFLAKKEGKREYAHFDGKSIAIGVGYDLLQHKNFQINALLKKTGLPPLTEEQKDLLNEARSKSCPATRRQEIAKDLDLKVPEHLMKKMFSHSLDEYENRLNTKLKPYDIPESTERVALLSLTYHGRLQNYKKGPNILAHILEGLENGDRHQVFLAIRNDVPKTKAHLQQGFHNRANSEANLFSPFERSMEQTRPAVLLNYLSMAQTNAGRLSMLDRFIVEPADKMTSTFKETVNFARGKIAAASQSEVSTIHSINPANAEKTSTQPVTEVSFQRIASALAADLANQTQHSPQNQQNNSVKNQNDGYSR